jgi:bis(5'-nucleosyl)-tetraphosphatase (symmetrical)
MATYALGDIQGCAASLAALLDLLPQDPARDRLWLVGDLVNRGPGSLEVLRWASAQGERVVSVLGNHDLHLLAVAAGLRELRPGDTLRPLLEAPDAEALLAWLRARPLLHAAGSHLMVHAGLLPEWDLPTARALAHELEQDLRSGDGSALLGAVGGPTPERWSDALRGDARRAKALEGFTLLRLCSDDGRSLPTFKGSPAEAPPDTRPWFDLPSARWRDDATTLVVGHWAALGLRQEPRLLALDTGCVWGGRLTAVRLEDGAVFSVPAAPGDARQKS